MFSWLATIVLGVILSWRALNGDYVPHISVVAAICHVALFIDNLIYFEIQQAVLNLVYVISYTAVFNLYWETEIKKSV
jgi:hypothetical protein